MSWPRALGSPTVHTIGLLPCSCERVSRFCISHCCISYSWLSKTPFPHGICPEHIPRRPAFCARHISHKTLENAQRSPSIVFKHVSFVLGTLYLTCAGHARSLERSTVASARGFAECNSVRNKCTKVPSSDLNDTPLRVWAFGAPDMCRIQTGNKHTAIFAQ